MARFFFGSNFKMHQTPDETKQFIDNLSQLLPAQLCSESFENRRIATQLFLIPPFTSLTQANDSLANSSIWLGAQNMHWASQGTHTGEISPKMLKAVGVDLVMLGHAERRNQFGETDKILRKKVNAAAEHGLRILLCVGENAEQRSNQIAAETVAIQLKIALADLNDEYLPYTMIAYEPVWSIGEGGSPAEPEIVANMHDVIRDSLVGQFGDRARGMPILYGGSVNPTNCATYAVLPQVDGLFVGRAAWSPEGFVEVLRRGIEAKENL
ncbi:MAG: triose-phosphate isomerase [Chloroflexota bacterium]